MMMLMMIMMMVRRSFNFSFQKFIVLAFWVSRVAYTKIALFSLIYHYPKLTKETLISFQTSI